MANLKDTVVTGNLRVTDTAAAERMETAVCHPLVTGTGTAGSAGSASAAYVPSLWVFDLDMTPEEGDVLTVKVPCAGTSSGVWMSVDGGTTYYPVAILTTTRFQNQFPVGMIVTVAFETGQTTNIYGSDQTGAAAGASTGAYTGPRWHLINYYDTTYSAATQALLTAGSNTTNRVIAPSIFKPSVIAIAEAAAASAAETRAVISEYTAGS